MAQAGRPPSGGFPFPRFFNARQVPLIRDGNTSPYPTEGCHENHPTGTVNERITLAGQEESCVYAVRAETNTPSSRRHDLHPAGRPEPVEGIRH
jgi:hypothetical protein